MSTETTAHITPQTSLAPAIQGWRIYLNDQGNSPYTLKAFTGDLNLLASYLPPDRTLESISTTDLNNFLFWMQNQRGVPCSPKTLARRITSIKAFFRWLHQNAILLIDPAEQVVQQSVLSPLPIILTADEVQLALAAADQRRRAAKPDTRHYALLLLLLETGIKKSECLALTLNHIDLEAQQGPIIFVRYASPQHRYKERKITVSPEWLAAFEEYKAQYNLTDGIFPWSPRRLEYLLEDISKEAGLQKHISFDMCRWTCAISDWKAGMDKEKIRQKLGVSKIQWRELRMKLERLAEEVSL
ncbi:MAG: tyrosine-type recombinase/integrase [Chloroflexota bacterium]